MEATPTRILVVDDHEVIRKGLIGYLAPAENIQVVGEAADGRQALDWLQQNEADLVLLDIQMEGMDGFACASVMMKDYPDLPIIVVSMYSEPSYIRKMMQVGIAGYLLKDCSQKELLKAIKQVIEGQEYYTPAVTQAVMSAFSGKKKANKPTNLGVITPLSDREKEVLKLIIEEHTNKEIADILCISPRTVDAHKRNLLEKTGAKNIAGLVMYAINQGLLEL